MLKIPRGINQNDWAFHKQKICLLKELHYNTHVHIFKNECVDYWVFSWCAALPGEHTKVLWHSWCRDLKMSVKQNWIEHFFMNYQPETSYPWCFSRLKYFFWWWACWYVPLVPALEQQMELNLCALNYTVSSGSASDIRGAPICKENYLASRKSSDSLRSSLQIYSSSPVPTG